MSIDPSKTMSIDVIGYLTHYGHLASGGVAAGAASAVDLQAALRSLQRMGGIPETGEADAATLELMSRKRCGCSDVQRLMATVEFARWRKNHLAYYVAQYVNGIAQADQDKLIARAFQSWADVANVTFERTGSPQADIVISTGRGPGQGFDGPSGVLMWAQMPNGTDMPLLTRSDSDESWLASRGQGGIWILPPWCHEFGHLLGLDHDNTPGQLMNPFVNESIYEPQANDIRRIQALYGPPATVPPVTPPVPQPPGVPVNPLPRDAIKQLIAFFSGADKSYRKAGHAMAKVIDYAADFLPDAPAATEALSDEQAMTLLHQIEAAPSGDVQAALSIPWAALVKWLLMKWLGA